MDEIFHMRNLCVDQLGVGFREVKTPEQIKKLFDALGYNLVSDNVTHRLSLLSRPTEGRNSHFQDSMEISEIVDALPQEHVPGERMNEMRAVSLLHDIGKTGPDCATPEEQQAFVEIFNFEFQQDFYDGVSRRDLPFSKALEIKAAEGAFSLERAREILQLVLAASARQDEIWPEAMVEANTLIRHVWAAHTYWGYDALRKEKLPDSIIQIAGSHHLMEGRNPAGIDLGNIDPAIAFIELADKYQAARVRNLPGGDNVYVNGRKPKTHEEAVNSFRARIQDIFAEHPKTMKTYLEVLDVIDKDQGIFEQELDIAV